VAKIAAQYEISESYLRTARIAVKCRTVIFLPHASPFEGNIMQRLILITLIAFLLGSSADAQSKKTPKAPAGKKKTKPAPPKKKAAPLPFKSLNDNVSYAIGLNFGRRLVANMKRQGIEIDEKKLVAALKIGKSTIADMKKQGLEVVENRLSEGFKTGLGLGKALMTDEQIGGVFRDVQKQMMAKAAERRKAEADKNKKAGEAYLAKNKTKKGVKTTKNGLQYRIIRAGKGKIPKASDTVVTHYRGTLIDGTEFDSSIKRGQPSTFPVNGVIKGWTEALQLMKVGAKWKLFIPANLAYGETGSGSGRIGPHATLVFELELLAIQAPPKSKKAPSKKP
jgi:FKBP-type peptidyl-prolyl cis-trans isomerase